MMEDPLEIVETITVMENTLGEAPEDNPVTADHTAEEANVTSTESEESEQITRGGSFPLAVEDVEG